MKQTFSGDIMPSEDEKSEKTVDYESDKTIEHSTSNLNIANQVENLSEHSKISRLSRSFHGKPQHCISSTISRRASSGQNELSASEGNLNADSSTKQACSRFTTTPVLEFPNFALKSIPSSKNESSDNSKLASNDNPATQNLDSDKK